MKSAAVALHCSDAGAPEVVQHFYQIFFREDIKMKVSNQNDTSIGTFHARQYGGRSLFYRISNAAVLWHRCPPVVHGKDGTGSVSAASAS